MFIETLNALKHVLWPTRCAACDVLLPEPDVLLCEDCSDAVQPAADFVCPDNIERACAVFRYEGAVQQMIAKWKYHEDYGARHALLACLPAQLERLRECIPQNACIIPVPPHPKRLRERGFDPVWQFANELHKLLKRNDIPTDFRDDVLSRTRHTPHQASLSHDERMHNLDGAFHVADGFTADHVVLIDDVVTTGATAATCALALKNAGIRHISFVALAYTAKS
ncbi:MAG: ComF family protein [Proteobacteria bacterium]|nr:ComF family protein [Pseudomonadota bacterium]